MRMTQGRLISVIMPVWNGEAYVREAVESVLHQHLNTEIVIVDDGSTDGSLERIADLGCRIVSIPHSGIARASNTGLAEACGEYVLFLDQDDVVCPGGLCALYDAFVQDDALQACTARAMDFISPELDEAAAKRLRPRPEPYYGLMSGVTLLRRDVIDVVGRFNEAYRAGQAVDYLWRVQESGVTMKKLDITAAMRRLHSSNTSRTMKDKQFSDYGAILRSRLGRRG